MIVIIISWLILLIFFIPTGIAAKSILKIKTDENYIPIFLGLFFQCLGLSICSLFVKIGLVVFIFNFFIIIALSIWKSAEIKNSLKEIKNDLKSLSKTSKFTLLTIFVFSLFKCAQYPFVIDNESYYLQTIKWINEYGFTKGLGNLHIFLGQSSPFHVLQAGFNLNFLTERINDINGFLLLISYVYFITEFDKRYFKNGEIHWIAFILIFNILFFQFINAPSPDLSLILVSQILFYHFVDKENTLDNFKIIALLFLYLLFVKITVAPFGLLVLYVLGFHKNRFIFLLPAAIITVVVLILKNSIITGYPFYPFDVFPLKVDWKIPHELLEFISSSTKKAGYFKNGSDNNVSLFVKLNSWFYLGGIKRIFNLGIIILFVCGLFTKKIQMDIRYKSLFLVLVIHFIILLLNSPQFRFFLPEFVFLCVLILSSISAYFKINIKFVQYALLISVISPMVLIEFTNYKYFTDNKYHQQTEKYKWG